mmetsp:Transcript_23848/g.49490  ORF Transcript_23848/g.49490 Transcript_23848/m.49490 type:complete len:609 (+) Transcript_23848:54-1880(+)
MTWRLFSLLCILGAERYAETEITCDDDTDSGAVSDASLLQMNLKLNSLPPACRIWQHTYILNAPCEHFGLGQAAGFLVSGASRSGSRFLSRLFQGLGMNVSDHSDSARGADGAVSWVHGLHRSSCTVPSWQSPRFFSKAFLLLRDPLKQIPSRARSIRSTEDFDWLEFARCAADFGPTTATADTADTADMADDRLRLALKHYVLQNSFVEKYAEKSFWLEDLDAHHPATLDIILGLCEEFASTACNEVKLRTLISGALPIDSEPLGVGWPQLAFIDRPFAAMAQILTRRHGKDVAVDDQLPEMAWGFDCDFHNDLWSCALPPEAGSLLDRSFSLQDMIRSKDTALCAKKLPPLNGSMVLSVSVARTGSETLSRMLESTGLNLHDHQCNAHTLLEHGAGHVIVSLRHPVSRIVSGMQWHTHVYNMTLAIGAFLNSSSSKLSIAGATGAHNEQSERSDRGQFSHGAYDLQHKVFSFDDFNHSYVDALRNTSDPNHRIALDVQYRPYSNSVFMPVVDFYIKGLTNEERGRVSFVCTCTLKEDMDRVSNELNLNLDTEILTHESVSSSDDPEVQLQWLSQRNIDWIREIYAADEAFYLQHCSHCESIANQAA